MKNKKLLGFLAAMACLTCMAGCKEDTNSLDAAKSYLDSIYKPQVTITASDTELYNKVTIDGVTYNVTWSVNVESGVKIVKNEDGTITLDIDENSPADVNYVLTATITDAEGNTIQASYNRTVPKFKELTWAEFTATEDEKAVVIKGVISGIVNTDTKHEIYLQDNDGGYYVYGVEAAKMEGLAVGMEIRVRGIRDTYYGVNQIVDAGIEILNATPTAVTPNDITTIFKDAESLQAESLTKLQSTVVTIKGVTILGQDAQDSSYYNFKLDDKQAYVRISSSACMFSSEDQTAFKKTVEDNKGYSADVTGVVSIYNNKIYLIPMTKDAFSNIAIIERNDTEKVAFEKEFVALPDYGDAIMDNLTLPTKGSVYENVTISWASSNEAVAKVDGGKLLVTLPKDAPTTVTLTATITSGEVSDTVVFENVPVAKESIYVPDAITSAPEVGKTYKMFLYQKNLNKTLYLEGSFDGNYLKTSPNPDLASDVKIVAAKEGTFYLQKADGAYININSTEKDGKVSFSLDTVGRDAKTEFKWSEEHGTIITADETAYIGTYNKYETISVSALNYISTSFPVQLCNFIDKTTATDEVKAAKELKDLVIDIESSYSISTAKNITLPTETQYFDGVTISWSSNNTAVASISGDQLTITPQETATTVTLTVTVTSGEKTATKDVTINVELAYLITVGTPSVAEYDMLYLDQLTTNQTLYLKGGMSGYYLAVTTNVSEAVTVGLEAVTGETGSYYLYYLDGKAKKYIKIYENADGYVNPAITDTAETKFTYSSKYNTLVTTLTGGKKDGEYFLGTYNDINNSFRPSKTSYLDSGSSNYITKFGNLIKSSEMTDAIKLNQEKSDLSVTFDDVTEDIVLNVPVAGSTFSNVAIAWESDNNCAVVNGNTITVTQQATEQIVNLKATLSIGTETPVVLNYSFKVAALPTYYYEEIKEAPVVGTAYKLHLYHSNLNKDLYLSGAMDGKYFGTTEIATDSVDVYVELVSGTTDKYNLYFLDGQTKKYVYIYLVTTDKDGATVITATLAISETLEATALPFVWNAELGTLSTEEVQTTNSSGSSTYNNTYFLGTGSTYTYTTLGASYKAADCKAILAVATEKSTADDTKKVAVEKEEVAKRITIASNVEESATINLPSVGYVFDDVTIAWESNSQYAAITDGVLTLTLPSDADASVTVTATITRGDVTDTVVYNFTAVQKFVVGIDVNKSYNLSATKDDTTYYFAGTLSSKAGTITSTASDAATIKFVATETENVYYITVVTGNDTKYVNMTANETKAFALVDTAAEATTWTFTADNQIVNTTHNTRAMALYVSSGTPKDIRTYAASGSYTWFWFNEVAGA